MAFPSLLVVGALSAQAPMNGGGVSQQEMRMGAASTTLDSNTLPLMTDKAFDTDSDSVDFEEGVLHWKGRTFNLGNNAVMRARFERYLASPGLTEGEQEYLKVMEEIEDRLLLVQNGELRSSDDVEKNMFEAWRLLFTAAEFEQDSGNSLLIASLVNNSWRVRSEGRYANFYESELNDQRNRLRDKIVADSFFKEKKYERAQDEARQGEQANLYPDAVTQGRFHEEDLLRVMQRIEQLNVQTAANAIEMKLQFQSQILSFLLQRRYRHTLIASAYYKHLFKGSHQGLEIGEAQLAEFLPDSNMSPTVDLLEFVAREAMRDVEIGMQTVESTYNNGELYAALKRIQETYFLGEYMPGVVQFDQSKKKQLLNLFHLTRDLQKVMDFKDYEEAESIIDQIRQYASDFPATSIITLINTAKRASNMQVLRARQAVATEDFERAEQAITKATEFWPLNPKVLEYSTTLADQADLSNQGMKIFDELYNDGDYRKIFDRKAEFGAALMKDPARSERLKEVIDTIGKIDISLAQARELLAQENPYFAWEVIRKAEAIYPDDLDLQRVKAEVSVQASTYAQTLSQAELELEDGRNPLALLYYLKVQKMYPASQAARLGIEKASESLMDAIEQRHRAATGTQAN